MPREPAVDPSAPAVMHGRSWDVMSYRKALAAEQGGSRAHLAAVAAGQAPLSWTVQPSLAAKVDEAGRFCPFVGDTVVFPLVASTFRVTLHDLSAAAPPGPPAAELEENEESCRPAFAEFRAALAVEPDARWIRMQPVRLFGCLDISVLGSYAPADELSLRRLLATFALFDRVRPLGYWLRPQVTLTYFRPRVPEPAELLMLDRRLKECEPAPALVPSTWVGWPTSTSAT